MLAMGSRVLARVCAKRLRWWAEHLDLMDESQCGFRENRSTADVSQIVIRMKEDMDDYVKRCERSEREDSMNERMIACMLDLEKAYPRVNKPALWMLLERYGMKGRMLETVMDLHETTEYRVKGKDGLSDAWTPARGLREGCATSPILFNIYHQAVMRRAGQARAAVSENVGIEWKWMPGSTFAGNSTWEEGSSETMSVRISELLFADDTTIVGTKDEIERGVREVKRVMGMFEERSNEAKEEWVDFREEESENVRILGSWIGAHDDVKMRIKRASGLWVKVKEQLKNTRLSRRWQGRIVEACVESALLFDCQARMWWKKDMSKLQKWMDKCYRYVWSNRRGQPLRQMQAGHENMWDVRARLGVKSVQWKIEKRVLERIGHVLRMSNERLTKVAVLGWYGKLEQVRKVGGRKRKTLLYWRRLLREAGIDCTDVERLSSDRKVWKDLVMERMRHLDVYERQKGHGYVWAANEQVLSRNMVSRQGELRCRYEGCGMVCRSKAGLSMHEKRRHRIVEERVRFECVKCGRSLETAGAKENHERACGGGRCEGGRRECGGCGRWITVGNFARHLRSCRVGVAAVRAVRRGVRGSPGSGSGVSPGGGGRVSPGRGVGGRRGTRGPTGDAGVWAEAVRGQHDPTACRQLWDPRGGPSP